MLVLDMGEPVQDRRPGARPDPPVRLHARSTSASCSPGLRPGEKLYEELLADDETTTRTPHPKLRIAQAREVPDNLLDELLPWLMQHRVLRDEEVRRDLRRWVPEYQTSMPPSAERAGYPGRAAHSARGGLIQDWPGVGAAADTFRV